MKTLQLTEREAKGLRRFLSSMLSTNSWLGSTFLQEASATEIILLARVRDRLKEVKS